MDEVRIIEISDEGVIYIDNLLADYSTLYYVLRNKTVCMRCQSKDGYGHVRKGLITYMQDCASVAMIHSIISMLDAMYNGIQKQAQDAISYSFQSIRAACRILGISEKEFYIKQSNSLNK